MRRYAEGVIRDARGAYPAFLLTRRVRPPGEAAEKVNFSGSKNSVSPKLEGEGGPGRDASPQNTNKQGYPLGLFIQ